MAPSLSALLDWRRSSKPCWGFHLWPQAFGDRGGHDEHERRALLCPISSPFHHGTHRCQQPQRQSRGPVNLHKHEVILFSLLPQLLEFINMALAVPKNTACQLYSHSLELHYKSCTRRTSWMLMAGSYGDDESARKNNWFLSQSKQKGSCTPQGFEQGLCEQEQLSPQHWLLAQLMKGWYTGLAANKKGLSLVSLFH